MNEDGTVNIYTWSCVGDRPWMSMTAPEPYVEPTRVRRTYDVYFESELSFGIATGPLVVPPGAEVFKLREVMPGDPPDWDALLDAIDESHTDPSIALEVISQLRNPRSEK